MSSKATFTDNSDQFFWRLPKAQQAGMYAAGNEYRRSVQIHLRPGYLSGDFATGTVVASVTVAQPVQEAGQWIVRVGTNLKYALFWELGHHNIFTRRYERVPIWGPMLQERRFAIAAAYARVVKRILGGST